MKHPFIILGSIGALLIIGGMVWVYLFLFYEPTTEQSERTAQNPFVEVDANSFETIDERDGAVNDTIASGTSTHIVGVTHRRVAGALMLPEGIIRIVEAGTGHVYDINQQGAERKVSNTTFPQTVEAHWSPLGTHVVVVREEEDTIRSFVAALNEESADENTLVGTEISGTVHNIGWADGGEKLFYTRMLGSGSEGVARDVATDKETVVFVSPLQNISVSWSTPELITTRPSNEKLGYAYDIKHSRVTDPAPALSGISRDNLSLFSRLAGDTLVSWIVRGKDIVPLDRGVIPEKCALGEDGTLCAVPKQFDAAQYPDHWYRGEESYDDDIVRIDARTGVSEPLGDLSTPFRNPLDIVHAQRTAAGALMLSKDGRLVYIDSE